MRSGTRPESIAVQEATLEGRRVELANVRNNASQRAQLQATLDEKKLLLKQAQQASGRRQELFDKGLYSRDDFEKAESSTKVANEAVRASDEAIHAFEERADNDAARILQEIAEEEKTLALMMAGTRKEEIQKAESDVKRLERVYANVARELKKSDIVARIDGKVKTEFVERAIDTHLNAGQELMQLTDTTTVIAQMMVPEKDLEDIQKGFPVRLQLASFSNRYFDGKVDYIALAAHTVDGQKVVTMHSYIANGDAVLKPELTGIAKIYCGKRPIIEIMTRRIGKWLRLEVWGLRP
jgi:multidrug resistance efflux pump